MITASLISVAPIAKAAAPVIKDIYEGAKGAARAALARWSANGFPKKVARQLVEIDSVRTIWSPEKNVSLRSFYYPCKLRQSAAKPAAIESIADLGDGCVVIQGIVGQGKSILMRYLALQEILKPDNPRLPVFTELRKVTKSTPLKALIFKSLSAYDIEMSDELFKYLASSGRLVLLLDGFDEIEPGLVREVTLELESIAVSHPDLQIIVSSRPNNEVQKLSMFRVLEIAQLTTSDYTPFLAALGISAEKISNIVHAINTSPSKISGVISTPLMLTLVVFVYQSEKQIPEDLPEFFERLFYTVFTRHDKLKAAFEREHHSGLSERKLQALFEAFCFMSLHLGVGRTLNARQFTEAFELAQEYIEGSACKEQSFRKDIVKVACLMLEEGVGDVTFLHKSIAEYHAAAFVKTSDDDFAERFYDEASRDWAKWQECLRFLQSIDPYRFAKFFAIKNLNYAITVFEKLAASSNSKEIIANRPIWITSMYLLYTPLPNSGGQYKRSAFGGWNSADNFYTSELSNVLSKLAFGLPCEIVTQTDVSGFHEKHLMIEDRGAELEVNFAQFLEYSDKISEFRDALNIHVESLKRKLAEAEAHALKLKKRASLFMRKD